MTSLGTTSTHIVVRNPDLLLVSVLGTTFGCETYELTEYSVILYDQEPEPDDERYDSNPESVGYDPHDRLWYVLPDGVRLNIPGLAPSQANPGGQSLATPAPSGGPVD